MRTGVGDAEGCSWAHGIVGMGRDAYGRPGNIAALHTGVHNKGSDIVAFQTCLNFNSVTLSKHPKTLFTHMHMHAG